MAATAIPNLDALGFVTNIGVPTTLATALTDTTGTTIVLTSGTNFPSTGGTIVIDSEQISYTTKSTNTLSGGARGVNGTTAATHLVSVPVSLLNTATETALKDAVKKTLKDAIAGDPRLYGLFVGQMSAEGFAVNVGIKAYVQSPTVKVELNKQASGQYLVRAYIYVGSAWTKVFQAPLYLQAGT